MKPYRTICVKHRRWVELRGSTGTVVKRHCPECGKGERTHKLKVYLDPVSPH